MDSHKKERGSILVKKKKKKKGKDKNFKKSERIRICLTCGIMKIGSEEESLHPPFKDH